MNLLALTIGAVVACLFGMPSEWAA